MENGILCKHHHLRGPVTIFFTRWNFLIELQEGKGKIEIKGEKNERIDERKSWQITGRKGEERANNGEQETERICKCRGGNRGEKRREGVGR